ncbi:AAA family ATPase [Phaeacidiphilus oryzae]|uniref:AAA family ATPase n=1 Tax=Phaeacidiphilus oryzae TaxID=348818 RepID=UPI001F3BE74C|nr:AAA family ATPase [Phaeacidiphilus oryzae]
MLEVTCAELDAKGVGQSAPKVRAVVHEALDGVLVIDEVYALNTEAVDALVRELDH